ncbi:PIN/TRAM domain-containing protein [Natroniella sulfidigena]|uniref:PIN/TRAM domain-containing protein n=1 Tax=Natroniella sulfidigena TaxID=723921 RepID=UPI00200B09E1|nr:PIN/TRAM domain-containing protein [Natroniella sulfidigena]MCK8816235.1 PIN/TRAM domain-containing protein [Natroniella sulfidigena]
MLNKLWRGFLVVVGAALGYQAILFLGLAEEFSFDLQSIITNNGFYGLIIGGLIGFILLPIIINKFVQGVLSFESRLETIPIKDIVSGIIGLILGLLLGILIIRAFSISAIPSFGFVLQLAINLSLAYLGWNLAIKKRDELFGIIAKSNFKFRGNSDESDDKKDIEQDHGQEDNKLQATYKILDTSAIIDGRIADLCQTSFLEGVLIIPEFVLEELQHIADSSDLLKRNRGRRGLDILKMIQKELEIPVEIYDHDFNEIDEVDSKLVKLAKLLEGKIITNDYNLNKVAEVQGVSVLNINELANAVKPVVLPGEEMEVKIIKDGKEPGQGVGYLDDGTMIVVDDAKEHIGEKIDILVTSVLQTAAGRMIFAKPKLAEEQVL